MRSSVVVRAVESSLGRVGAATAWTTTRLASASSSLTCARHALCSPDCSCLHTLCCAALSCCTCPVPVFMCRPGALETSGAAERRRGWPVATVTEAADRGAGRATGGAPISWSNGAAAMTVAVQQSTATTTRSHRWRDRVRPRLAEALRAAWRWRVSGRSPMRRCRLNPVLGAPLLLLCRSEVQGLPATPVLGCCRRPPTTPRRGSACWRASAGWAALRRRARAAPRCMRSLRRMGSSALGSASRCRLRLRRARRTGAQCKQCRVGLPRESTRVAWPRTLHQVLV